MTSTKEDQCGTEQCVVLHFTAMCWTVRMSHYLSMCWASFAFIEHWDRFSWLPSVLLPSVLWRCCLSGRKNIWPEWWDAGLVMCLGEGADLHITQLMPLPLTISCSSKSRLVLPFWCRLTGVVLERIQDGCKTVVCVRACVCVFMPVISEWWLNCGGCWCITDGRRRCVVWSVITASDWWWW